jgi:hypothetical protein
MTRMMALGLVPVNGSARVRTIELRKLVGALFNDVN